MSVCLPVRLSHCLWRCAIHPDPTAKVSKQVNRKCRIETRTILHFSILSSTLFPQTLHTKIKKIVIYYVSPSWSRDHFVYVSTNIEVIIIITASCAVRSAISATAGHLVSQLSGGLYVLRVERWWWISTVIMARSLVISRQDLVCTRKQ